MSKAGAVKQEAEGRQYLTFHLGGEVFAVGILAVKEIIEYVAPTVVPLMPATVRGVINLRGAVLPVIDLSVRFGREAAPVGRRTCIIVVEAMLLGERQVMGVLVDAVDAVLEIPLGGIGPAPAFGARIRADFIAGIARLDERFVILVDLDAVLAMEDVLTLTQVAEQAA